MARRSRRRSSRGVFIGETQDTNGSQELHITESTDVDRGKQRATVELAPASMPAAGRVIVFTHHRQVAAIDLVEKAKAELAAAEAYRAREVTPRFKEKAKPVDDRPLCPECDGRRTFDGEACPVCFGTGRLASG